MSGKRGNRPCEYWTRLVLSAVLETAPLPAFANKQIFAVIKPHFGTGTLPGNVLEYL